MSKSESTEMYLETIYLLEKNHGHAHAVEIAERLNVSKPSVTKAMNSLKEDGLIDKEAYGTISLTHKGKELSKRIYTRHKLLTYFLHYSLGLAVDEAEKNACKMEHVVTDELIVKVKEYLDKRENDEKLKGN
ncbi:MAG: metal-dependent transcriptional regulator [Clostridia bacterium]